MRWRYRPFQAAAIAALAALITACATFAPLYDRAMQQSLTDISVADEPPAVVGLGLQALPTGSAVSPPTPETVLLKIPADVASSYDEPILGWSASVMPLPGAVDDPTGELLWREGACDHVELVDGGCPAGPGEIAVSTADVENFGYEVGTTFRADGAVDSDVSGGRIRKAKLEVVGVYRFQPGDYWFGHEVTGRSGVATAALTATPHVQHDAWLTDRSTFQDSSIPPLALQATTVDLVLDTTTVGVDELFATSDAIEALAEQERLDTDPDFQIVIGTGLPDIAQDVRDQQDQSRVTVPLLMAQLGLLAIVVLWLVLLAVTEQRRPEVALARLRGRGRRGARGLLLGELLPVALVGVLPGAALAVLGAWLARAVVLPGDAPFELRTPFYGALLLAAAALVAVTVLAVVRVAREQVQTLLRRIPPRRAGWGLGVGDALVIAGSGSLVIAFATGGLDGAIALAAPGLMAVAVGLVLAHLTTPTAALLGGRLLRRGRVRAAVSVLDAARSPATRRIVAVVTIAAALAVFSADAYVVGDRNRALAAEQEAGAPLVVMISGTDLAGTREALAEVDPEGREVTPVVRVTPPGSGAAGTLAVVPDGFRTIALFPGQAPPASLWDGLAVPDAEPIAFAGTRLDLDFEDSTLEARRIGGEVTPVTVGLELVRDGETLRATLGELAPSEDAHFEEPVSCADGCYLTGIFLKTFPGARVSGAATLRNVVGRDGDAVDEVAIGPADQWRTNRESGSVEPSGTSPDELTITADTEGASDLTLHQVWVPTVVPALAPATEVATDATFTLTGLDGEVQTAVSVGSLARIPANSTKNNLVNLDLVQRGTDLAANAHIELWFARDDPALLADVVAALDEHDVSVSETRSITDVRRSYDASVATWSLELAVLVGLVSVLIALLVLVVSAASGWRFRTRDLAALRMSGVSRRSIRSMSVAGQLFAVVVGVVAGGVCGLVGAQLALPIVPFFPTAPEVSTLDLDTAWLAATLAGLGALVVLGAGATLIGRALAGRAELRRLREGM